MIAKPLVSHEVVQPADLRVNKLILFLVFLAISLEVLLYLRFLLSCQQAVRPMPPAELQKPLSLGPAGAELILQMLPVQNCFHDQSRDVTSQCKQKKLKVGYKYCLHHPEEKCLNAFQSAKIPALIRNKLTTESAPH